MNTFLALAAVVSAESLGLVMCSGRSWPGGLGYFAVVNMVAIGLFAPVVLEMAGYVTNVGNLWYASVVAAQCLTLELRGVRAARRVIGHVYGAMIVLVGICTTLQWFPPHAGEAEYHVRSIIALSPQITAAGFCAFGISQIAMIAVWNRLAGWPALPRCWLALLVCQSIDTPVFFAIAFWSNDNVLEMLTVGFLVKVAAGTLLLPAIWLGRLVSPLTKTGGKND